MLLAAVPGGRFAPHFVKIGNGNVPLSIEVTLFLAKLTAFTAAPTARLLLGVHAIDVREVPLILQLILLQIVPLYAGKWIRRKHQATARRLLQPAQRVALVAMLTVFVAVLLGEDRGLVELAHDRAWIAVAATGIAWPLVGWLLAGRRPDNRRAFAILANAREVALALVLASLAFPAHGVHTALFGVWSIYTIVTTLIAAGHAVASERQGRRSGTGGAGSGPFGAGSLTAVGPMPPAAATVFGTYTTTVSPALSAWRRFWWLTRSIAPGFTS